MSKRDLEIDLKVNGRPCVANIKGVPTEAYFHCWEHWSNVVSASALVGGHAAGQVSMVHAIVELQDGRVCRCDPADVCFTPNESIVDNATALLHSTGINQAEDTSIFKGGYNLYGR